VGSDCVIGMTDVGECDTAAQEVRNNVAAINEKVWINLLNISSSLTHIFCVGVS
jgi:hypothetical protein